MSVPDLNLSVESASTNAESMAPEIHFRLRVENRNALPIQSILLYCQIQLAIPSRRYTSEEKEQLTELFGARDQWSRTLRSMAWGNFSRVVPGFVAHTAVDLPAPCTFDFNVAATKYFSALADGDVPLAFFFNGTTFYCDDDGTLKAAPISWDTEAHFNMPVRLWRDVMETHYQNEAWLCLRREVFDRLRRYKVERGFLTFEDAMEDVLP